MGEFFLSLGNDLQNDSGWNVNANTEQGKIWERWRKRKDQIEVILVVMTLVLEEKKEFLTAQQELNQIRSDDQEW